MLQIYPCFRRGRHENSPTGDIFDQPPGDFFLLWDTLADHLEDHVVLSSEGAVLVTSPGTESSYPRPRLSLNDSESTRKIKQPWVSCLECTFGLLPAYAPLSF